MWKQLVSINKRMLYTDSGTLFPYKNEYICDACCNLDEPWKNTKWSNQLQNDGVILLIGNVIV